MAWVPEEPTVKDVPLLVGITVVAAVQTSSEYIDYVDLTLNDGRVIRIAATAQVWPNLEIEEIK